MNATIMTQEEFDKAPLLDQILYDTTGMLVENHKDIAEAMKKYHKAKLKLLGIDDIGITKQKLCPTCGSDSLITLSDITYCMNDCCDGVK